jgi:hypothetical protein
MVKIQIFVLFYGKTWGFMVYSKQIEIRTAEEWMLYETAVFRGGPYGNRFLFFA